MWSYPKYGTIIYTIAAINDPNPSINPASNAIIFFDFFTSSYYAKSIAIAPPSNT